MKSPKSSSASAVEVTPAGVVEVASTSGNKGGNDVGSVFSGSPRPNRLPKLEYLSTEVGPEDGWSGPLVKGWFVRPC